MTVARLLPTPEARELVQLAAEVADKALAPIAVQVFGGYGYIRDYRVERYMRGAKITQIFEGTNQIQRLVIGRSLSG